MSAGGVGAVKRDAVSVLREKKGPLIEGASSSPVEVVSGFDRMSTAERFGYNTVETSDKCLSS